MAALNNRKSNTFELRDYHHAAKTFTSDPGYTNLPYHSFLFHVEMTFNSLVSYARVDDTKTISVLVKSASLPNIKFETETLNQYNRKRLVPTKVTYDPISITLHDDVANHVRNLWIDYHSYMSNDPNWSEANYQPSVYVNEQNLAYGLDGPSAASATHQPLLRSLRVYSMGNHQQSEMHFINPVITGVNFSDHDYAAGAETMQIELDIDYESILYERGTTDEIATFGENNIEHYDQNTSVLTPSDLNPGGSPIDFATRTLRDPFDLIPGGDFLPRTAAQAISQEFDNIPGNVNNIARNLARFTERQFFEINQLTASSATRQRTPFSFPVAGAVGQGDEVDILQQRNFDDLEVRNSVNITSNGSNVSTTNVRATAPVTNLGTAQNSLEQVLTVNPVIPSNLTSVEKALFEKSYPPLPSTDPRTSLPPYV